MRRASVLVLSLLLAVSAQAAVVHLPIASDLVLKPGENYTATVESTEPVEIGWQTLQSKVCTTNCIEATDLTGGINYRISTPRGASMKYTPHGGKIAVEYKNVSSEPVTITVYRVKRTCEAEACKFLDNTQKTRWLVFKVDEFRSITTSTDESYSVISGATLAGRPFRVRAVWWSEQKTPFIITCAPSIKRYLDSHAAKAQYSPYIISGQAFGEGDAIVLNRIDTCAPKAPNFGVPDGNVFK
jgi:hypothetical protein